MSTVTLWHLSIARAIVAPQHAGCGMSEIGKRIKQAREAKKLTLAEVGAACNPPITPQSVHKWEKGDSVPRSPNLVTLCRLTGRTMKWFLEGVEDVLQLRGVVGYTTTHGKLVPMVDFATITAHLAGIGNLKPTFVRANFPCSDNSFQTFVNDDANDPEIKVGASVIIDLERAPSPGKFCLAIHNGQPLIRRYRPRKKHVELVPANDDWDVIEVDPDAIIGTVSEITHPQ